MAMNKFDFTWSEDDYDSEHGRNSVTDTDTIFRLVSCHFAAI